MPLGRIHNGYELLGRNGGDTLAIPFQEDAAEVEDHSLEICVHFQGGQVFGN